ncbi:MAG: lysylphosphatidylglycerol synthase transmembrane domain-containing protein [Deltaproteobacteria bacterium]|nr:lysylphosphatidylglycerol synthase transmembrane domain-containing protein [Deltaproteobacteria bacterium]
MRKYVRWLPLAFLAFALAKLKPWKTEFANVNAWPLLLGLLINFCVYLPLRTLRWRTTLSSPPRFMRLYWAQIEGIAVGGAVGFGAQDVVRAARVRNDMSRFSDDFGATLAERLAETQALALMLAGATALKLVPSWGWLPSLGAGLGLVAIAKLGPRLSLVFARWPKIARALIAVSGALTVAKVAKVVAFSLLGWATEVVILVLNFLAFSLPALFSNAVLVVIGINVAITFPGPPASVGTFEAGVAGTLAWRGIAADKALAFALAYHVIMALPVYAVGAGIVVARAYRRKPA